MEAEPRPACSDDAQMAADNCETTVTKLSRRARKLRNKQLRLQQAEADRGTSRDHGQVEPRTGGEAVEQQVSPSRDSFIQKDPLSPAQGPSNLNDHQHQTKGNKKKKKNQNREFLNNPDKILEAVLASGTGKTLGLCDIVARKFQDPEYSPEMAQNLKDVVYSSEVQSIYRRISVLPSRFSKCKVNITPFAITNLPCIYEKTPKRSRPQKRSKQNNNKKKKDTDGAANSNEKSANHLERNQRGISEKAGNNIKIANKHMNRQYHRDRRSRNENVSK